MKKLEDTLHEFEWINFKLLSAIEETTPLYNAIQHTQKLYQKYMNKHKMPSNSKDYINYINKMNNTFKRYLNIYYKVKI